MADVQNDQEFAADWTGADATEAQLVNQILGQVGVPEASGPDGIYLTFGVVTPPIIVGAPEIVAKQLANYGGRLPVKTVSRIRITRDKAAELLQVLETTIGHFDDAASAARAAQMAAGESKG